MNTYSSLNRILALTLLSLVGLKVNAQFAAPIDNPFGLSEYQEGHFVNPIFVDFDNDGDKDMMSTMVLDGGLGPEFAGFELWENIGTAQDPFFSEPIWNPYGLEMVGGNAFSNYIAYAVCPGDLDNDGDVDLLASVRHRVGNEWQDLFKYYENVGTDGVPMYGSPEENPFELIDNEDLGSPHLSDYDGDGDLDLLHTVFGETDNMFVRENIGTISSPEYTESVPLNIEVISDYGYINKISSGDLDNDGDLDMICGVRLGGEFRIYLNSGEGTFQEVEPNTFELLPAEIPHYPILVDLDNDEDLDIITATRTESSPDKFNFRYFENLSVSMGMGSAFQSIQLLEIHVRVGPNPTSSLLKVQTNGTVEMNEIRLYDLSGKEVLFRLVNASEFSFDMSPLKNGYYILKLETDQGIFSRKVCLRK